MENSKSNDFTIGETLYFTPKDIEGDYCAAQYAASLNAKAKVLGLGTEFIFVHWLDSNTSNGQKDGGYSYHDFSKQPVEI